MNISLTDPASSQAFEVIFRLILAAMLGGLIGLERESLNKSAGFRTHILVSVGSALIMLVSIDMYHQYKTATNNIDPGRIAAQVISGIGFLGAGTIMREGATVRGLTTAASLWVVAGLGLAVGAGLYFPAAIATGIVFLTLVYLGRVEKFLTGKHHYHVMILLIDDQPGQIGRIGEKLGQLQVAIRHIEMKSVAEERKLLVELFLQPSPGVHVQELIQELAMVPGVHRVQIED